MGHPASLRSDWRSESVETVIGITLESVIGITGMRTSRVCACSLPGGLLYPPLRRLAVGRAATRVARREPPMLEVEDRGRVEVGARCRRECEPIAIAFVGRQYEPKTGREAVLAHADWLDEQIAEQEWRRRRVARMTVDDVPPAGAE